MNTINVYKERPFTLVKLIDPETKKPLEYKLPNEYTVNEVERLIELQILREQLEDAEVSDKSKQLDKFWSIVFDQLEILFQHFQPELSAEKLKKIVTHDEALKIIGGFNDYRLRKEKGASGKKKA